MVFDNHQCSRLIGPVYASGCIGKKNLFNAQTLHNPNWKSDQSLTVSLIIMNSALHGNDSLSHARSQHELSCMACHCGYRKIRDIMVGNLYRIFNLIRIIPQSASQNHADFGLKIRLFADDADRILDYL